MKTKIFNLIILDESGSMASIKPQAVSGVNETIQTIRNAQKEHKTQEHYLSLVLFNGFSLRTLFDKCGIDEINELAEEDYRPNSNTPLYDAMGVSLTKLREDVSSEDKVLVTIITDGYENSSRDYSGRAIKLLVEGLKRKGWIFTYIGANQDVEEFASSISITNTLKFESTREGTFNMFIHENSARKNLFDRIDKGEDNLGEAYFIQK